MIPRQRTAEIERANPDGRKERISRFVKLYSVERPRPEGIHSDGRRGIDTLDQNK